MDFQILIANSGDLQAILDLQKECYLSEAELHNEYNIPPLTQTIESVQEEFENGWLFLKFVLNEEIIASGRGYIKDETAFIGKLVVKKEFQNQKLGQTLLKEIESRLGNCKRYELFTGNKSERNIYLYKKLGYQEFKRQFINENLTLVYLEKIQ
jgi:ribosomal protein S18 acetylase RimI-like enzyme